MQVALRAPRTPTAIFVPSNKQAGKQQQKVFLKRIMIFFISDFHIWMLPETRNKHILHGVTHFIWFGLHLNHIVFLTLVFFPANWKQHCEIWFSERLFCRCGGEKHGKRCVVWMWMQFSSEYSFLLTFLLLSIDKIIFHRRSANDS